MRVKFERGLWVETGMTLKDRKITLYSDTDVDFIYAYVSSPDLYAFRPNAG
jgi:hypothetical protein